MASSIADGKGLSEVVSSIADGKGLSENVGGGFAAMIVSLYLGINTLVKI